MHNAELPGGFAVICSSYLCLSTGAAAWHRGETILAEGKRLCQAGMQRAENFIHWGQGWKSCIDSLFQSLNFSVPAILKDLKPTWSFCESNPPSIEAEEKEWARFPPLWAVSILPLIPSSFSLLSHLPNNLCQGSATAHIKWPLTAITQKYFCVSSRFTQGTPASPTAIPHWHTKSSWILRHSCDTHYSPYNHFGEAGETRALQTGLNGNY